MVSLSSKHYFCYLPDESYKVKVSAKGIQQGRGRNNDVLNPDGFETVVRDRITLQAKFDRRTPGLFKDEWSGDAMVSLSSKHYFCYLPDESYKVKVSAKGIQQGRGRNNDVLALGATPFAELWTTCHRK
ncbi:hypothetical protein ON010_g17901 [Phytophthora cinnamomi]|nr:hypothetical protein ON010_g17901 [Phytophthora cinnamomi]